MEFRRIELSRVARSVVPFLFALVVSSLGQPLSAVSAQGTDAADLFEDFSLGEFGNPGASGLSQQDPAEVEADYAISNPATGELVIRVRVRLAGNWHIYSLTQPEGGPLPTKLKLIGPNTIQLTGEWQSDAPPKRSVSEQFEGITIEEHDTVVTFFAPAKLVGDGLTPVSVGPVQVSFNALACVTGGACRPLEETLIAKFAGVVESKPANDATVGASDAKMASAKDVPASEFRDEDYSVRWKASVLTPFVAPGQTGWLQFTAIPDPKFHVYPAAVNDDSNKTNFVITGKSGLRVAMPTTDNKVIKEELAPGFSTTYHDGQVTWKLPFQVPSESTIGTKQISGSIVYQACTATSCLPQKAIRFDADIDVTPNIDFEVTAMPLSLVSTDENEVLEAAAAVKWVDKLEASPSSQAVQQDQTARIASGAGNPNAKTLKDGVQDDVAAGAVAGSEAAISFPMTLGFAFLGGIILNFMPCVLPVVGLKVMSFVQQAGADKKKAFLLNFSYALGIMAIYVGLAVLMVVFSMAWGEMFTFFEVRLALIVLMFAMALSYFGFWEIPAPGAAAGKTAQTLQSQEGYTGAFFKGMFATILSTPCSGPFLGGIFALIGGKLPPAQSTLVVLVVGIGMAIPYILMGIWPRLMSWLPKPGPWMETFKEFLGFLFLATVAFFFYSFSDHHRVPVFITLMGVWFGCWIVGLVPAWQTIQKRLVALASGVAVAGCIGVLSFAMLGASKETKNAEKIVTWEPYNEVRLEQLQAEGKTVLVDFSAKWCVNCLVNLKVAIDTKPTAKLIEELDAVAMYADWTDRDPEIKAKLAELESNSIPLLAIYPGNNPENPIVLRDLVSQQGVLNALRDAGPSQTGSSVAELADTSTHR